MDAIQKSLSNKILGQLMREVLPMTVKRISAALDVSEFRISTCLKELMLADKIQLSGDGGYCVMGWEGKELSAADIKERAIVMLDKKYVLMIRRDELRAEVNLCTDGLLAFRDCEIKKATGIKSKALRTLIKNRCP